MTILLSVQVSPTKPKHSSETFHVLIHEQVSPIYIPFFLLPSPCLYSTIPFTLLVFYNSPLFYMASPPPFCIFPLSLPSLPLLTPSPLLSSPLSVIILLFVVRNMKKSLPYISELLSHFRMK